MFLNINLQNSEKQPIQQGTENHTDQKLNFNANYTIEIPKNLQNEIFLLLDETSTFQCDKLIQTLQLEEERQWNLYQHFQNKEDFENYYSPQTQNIIQTLQQQESISKFDTLLTQNQDPLQSRQKLIMQDLKPIKKIYCHLGTDEDTYYTSRIYDIYFTENQKYFIASSTNGQIKIFETETLLLQRTLKGMNQEITMIVADQQTNILCFTDGKKVFIYRLKDFKKLCVLEVPDVEEFSCMDIYSRDDQTIIFLSDNNNGFFIFKLINENQLQQIDVPLYVSKFVKQFELDKKKQILYTYRQDYIDLWNVKDFIDDKKIFFQPQSSILTNQQAAYFYITIENNIFIAYDKNYHTICKIINNEYSEELLKQKYKKLNFQQKERNQAICANKNFSVIAVNTFQKSENDDEEFEQQNYELYIYANVNSNEVHLLDHINQENNPTILKLDDSVCVVSTNPVFQNIFLIGLSEGNLIILDVENLQVLKIISENCDHLKQPSLKNPVLEAQFLSNGMDIITGTFFGSFSLYSIDVLQHNKLQSPDQQFFLNDYIECEDDIQGGFCDANMKSHKQFYETDIEKIYQHFYELDINSSIQELLKKNDYKNKEFEYEMKKQKQKMQQQFNICEEPQIIQLYDYRTKEEIRERERILLQENSSQQFSQNSSIDDNLSQQHLRRTRRISFQHNNENGHRLKSKRLRNKNFKISDSCNDEEIENDQQFYNQNREISINRSPKKEQKKSLKIEEENDNIQDDKILNFTCIFCNSQQGQQYYSCQDCLQNFCESCASKVLFQSTNLKVHCFQCYFSSKIQYIFLMKWSQQKIPSRFYNNIEMQNFVEESAQILIYQPQIEETYYFIPQAFANFFKNYLNHFEPNWALENMKNFLLLEHDFEIKIIDYQYCFPQIHTRNDLRLCEDLQIIQKIKAQILQDENYQNGNKQNEIEFYFSYTDKSDQLFLIPKGIYEYCNKETKLLPRKSLIQYKGEDVFLNKIIIGKSLFESIQYFKIQEGKNLRNQNKSQEELGHPWFITKFIDNAENEQKQIQNQIIGNALQNFIKLNRNKYYPFIEAVDKNYYPEYQNFVVVEMYLQLIEDRLSNQYYFSKNQLFKDFELIEQNCKSFNLPDSDISKLSENLVKDLKKLVNNLQRSRAYRRPMLYEKNHLQDNQLLSKRSYKN